MLFLPKHLVLFPFLHKKGWLAVIYNARQLLDFGGVGEKSVSKNVSKRLKGKNGKSQINTVPLWDTNG